MREKFSKWSALLAIAAFYLGMQLFGITCPIKYLTGISCAGCGMTRAYFALLTGDVGLACSYHPLFMLPPVMLVWFLFKRKIPKKLYWAGIWCVCALFLIVYVIRMLDPNDSVVVFEPENGMIASFVRTILCFVN